MGSMLRADLVSVNQHHVQLVESQLGSLGLWFLNIDYIICLKPSLRTFCQQGLGALGKALGVLGLALEHAGLGGRQIGITLVTKPVIGGRDLPVGVGRRVGLEGAAE